MLPLPRAIRSDRDFFRAAGIPLLKEVPPGFFNDQPLWLRDAVGGVVPAIGGGAQEQSNPVGTISVTWSAVSATPDLQRLQLVGKTLHRRLLLRFSGTWDQSVGAETQATEGNPALIREIRINADGRIIRRVPGYVLYELNRITNAGAGPKSDPATGTGTGKAFSSTLYYDFGLLDCAEQNVREATYLDLSQYANVYLEVQFNAFNRYVSGNTQANMTASLVVSTLEIIGPRRIPQPHFEVLPIHQGVDMSVTGTDRRLQLLRSKFTTRGFLLRVGTLNATPMLTAITALTQVGIEGKLLSGPTYRPKEKLPVAAYQQEVGIGRSGISLTAGYLWLDLASDRRRNSHLAADSFADWNLLYDVTGTASTLLEVYQVGATR